MALIRLFDEKTERTTKQAEEIDKLVRYHLGPIVEEAYDNGISMNDLKIILTGVCEVLTLDKILFGVKNKIIVEHDSVSHPRSFLSVPKDGGKDNFIMERKEGYYWTRLSIEFDWEVSKYANGRWYYTGSSGNVRPPDIINEERLPEPSVLSGALPPITKERTPTD